jgi:hypothetical protein
LAPSNQIPVLELVLIQLLRREVWLISGEFRETLGPFNQIPAREPSVSAVEHRIMPFAEQRILPYFIRVSNR